jgi:ankyrin repeat protein
VCSRYYSILTESRTVLTREIQSSGSLDDILERASTPLNKFSLASTGMTVLHRAVLHDDILAIKLLLDAKMEVNCTTSSGVTALQVASLIGNVEVVRFLLEASARSSEIAGGGITALHLPVCSGHREIVEILVKAKAALNGGAVVGPVSEGGLAPAITALHIASAQGDENIVKILLSANAAVDVDAMEGGDYTPLYCAAKNGHVGIVEDLLAAGADVNKADDDGWTVLHTATDDNNSELLTTLLAANADVNAALEKSKATALHIAARRGYKEAAKQLVDAGADLRCIDIS